MGLAYRAGDALAWLGWRPPIRTTAAARRSAAARSATTASGAASTGIEPQSLAAALAAEPASVQERWFSRLYLLKPLAIGTFALFWLLTGLDLARPGLRAGDPLHAGAAAAARSSEPSVVAGAPRRHRHRLRHRLAADGELGLWAALARLRRLHRRGHDPASAACGPIRSGR